MNKKRFAEFRQASAEVYNQSRRWLTGRNARSLEGLKKEKLVRRSRKNESGKAAVIPADEVFRKVRERHSVSYCKT